MPGHSESLNRHYAPTDICARIVAMLHEAGKDVARLSRDDLAPFDEFHGGGRTSTRELARYADLAPGMKVLDVGSGVGGPARTLAAEFGCTVTGMDITAEYCRAAEMLTSMVGLGDAVEFRCGDALEMPFENGAFDTVWSQNTLMNIEDKARLFAEVRRVLRPGGLFVFEAILAGPVAELHYPVFWAASPALSFLVDAAEARALLAAVGLRERAWEDTTARTIANQRKRMQIVARDGPPPLSLSVIAPVDFEAKIANVLRNNEQGRTVTMQAVYVR